MVGRLLSDPRVVLAAAGLFIGIGAMFTAALMVTVATGIPMRPAFSAAAGATALTAVLLLYAPVSTSAKFVKYGRNIALHIIMLLVLAAGEPFGASLGENTLMQMAGLLLYGGLAAATLHYMPVKHPPRPFAALNRHEIEAHLICLLQAGGFLFFGLIVILPFLIMLLTSFKSQQALLLNPLDFSLSFANGLGGLFRSYIELFRDYHFGVFMANTAIVSAATVIITLLFSVPGAYAVARLRFRGKKTLARSILLIYMVPAIVLVIPLYAVFSSLGIRNSFLGLLIAYPATTIPVALYMLQGYFRELPAELEEAGLIDGLSRWRVIFHITLPLSLPALSSVSLYVFMIAWNEFLFSFMFLDNPQLFTLSRAVMSLNSSEVPRQHLMAGAVVSTLPVLIIFLWAERFLIKGLTAGSVKG